MTTKHIPLEDGIMIEAEILKGQTKPISGGPADKITFDKIEPLLLKLCDPIVAAWKKISQDILIEQAEVDIGLSFEAGGNLLVTKSKAGANITVKLLLKPKR